MSPTRWKINWRKVVQLGLGVAAGLVAAFGALAVAVTSFSLSFDAITAVAKAARIRDSRAWMMPVSVDGAILVAAVAAVVMSRLQAGKRVLYPWTVVVIGVVISILCNAAHSTGHTDAHGAIALDLHPIIRGAISAIPALMLALAVHLVIELLEAFMKLASPDPNGPEPTRSIDPIDRVVAAARSTAADARPASVSMPIDAGPGTRSLGAGGALDPRADQQESTRSIGSGGAQESGRPTRSNDPIDRVGAGAPYPMHPANQTGTETGKPTRSNAGSGTRSTTRSNAAQGTARSGRSAPKVTPIKTGKRRSMDDLREQLRAGIAAGQIDPHPAADPIREFLRCSPKRSRDLRDEFAGDPIPAPDSPAAKTAD
ncbi:DUF2637 domain-containing protein [Actinomadura violacea]|uniref:DUF2637 domain-containing protein n=1 Tax=Actinomadura violacea TaxID=2819934 RepID=A0ABS3RY05_9ACTN|nr:DUF2637 domain-containing protein [Actinomadura violacea]MBO2461637.1 DUF2637 domain-containing protein [Actinomadura violacea]